MGRLHIGKIFTSGAGLYASLLGNAFIFLVIARVFGAAEFGQFALTYATASLLGLIVDFAYQQRFLRDFYVYTEKYGGLPFRTVATKLALLVIATLLNIVVSVTLGIDLALMAVIWTGIVLMSFGVFFGSCLRAMGEHRVDSINLVVANSIVAAMTIGLFLAENRNPFLYFSLFIVLGAIYFPLSLIAFRNRSSIAPEKPTVSRCMGEIRSGLSYAADLWVTRSSGFLDVLVLSLFVTNAGLGLYQAGQKLMLVAFAVNQIVNNVFLPIISARERHVRLDGKSLVTITGGTGLLGLTVSVVFYLIYPFAIDILYGSEFSAAKDLGLWLSLTIWFRLCLLGPSIWLVAAGYQSLRLVLNSVNIAFFLVLCAVFAPLYGFVGGAIATAVATFLWAVMFAIAAYVIARGRKTSAEDDQSANSAR